MPFRMWGVCGPASRWRLELGDCARGGRVSLGWLSISALVPITHSWTSAGSSLGCGPCCPSCVRWGCWSSPPRLKARPAAAGARLSAACVAWQLFLLRVPVALAVQIFSAVIWPQPDAAGRGLLAIVSIAAGWISWRCIEEPFRAHWLSGWQPARLVAGTLILTAALAWATGCPPGATDAVQRDIAQQRIRRPASVDVGCHASLEAVDLPDCVFGARMANARWCYGATHAVNWFPAFELLAREQAGGSWCSPSRAAPAWTCRSGAEALRRGTPSAHDGAVPCSTGS